MELPIKKTFVNNENFCILCKTMSARSHHLFPRNTEARDKWVTALKLNASKLKKSSRICSLHFHPNAYSPKAAKRPTLLSDALPTKEPTLLNKDDGQNATRPIGNRKEIIWGHKGEQKTHRVVGEHYAITPISIIKRFIDQCETCKERRKRRTQPHSSLIHSVTANELNQAAQVNIIDFQNLPDGEFKFILHYQDCFTKFSFLRPLTSKNPPEVAKVLLSIFLEFGPPQILQSDNLQFIKELIDELRSLWPSLNLLQSVEESNCFLKHYLVTWMQRYNISAWSSSLGFVQWEVNTTYHLAIRKEPYEAVFGQKAKTDFKTPVEHLNLLSEKHEQPMVEDYKQPMAGEIVIKSEFQDLEEPSTP